MSPENRAAIIVVLRHAKVRHQETLREIARLESALYNINLKASPDYVPEVKLSSMVSHVIVSLDTVKDFFVELRGEIDARIIPRQSVSKG